MGSKTCSSLFLVFLIGSSLCVIPEGEYQFGPVFGHAPAARFFGNKYFEAFLDKGQLKPLLAKKVLLGVGAVGVAAAAGGAALIAKKIHENKGFGHGHSGGWYSQPSHNNYYQTQQKGGSGWYSPSTSYSQGSSGGWSSLSSSSEGDYNQGGYGGKVNYPGGNTATQFHYESKYPSQGSSGGYEDNNSAAGGYDYSQGQSAYYGNSGWSK